jgi:hypothetical protein
VDGWVGWADGCVGMWMMVGQFDGYGWPVSG